MDDVENVDNMGDVVDMDNMDNVEDLDNMDDMDNVNDCGSIFELSGLLVLVNAYASACYPIGIQMQATTSTAATSALFRFKHRQPSQSASNF